MQRNGVGEQVSLFAPDSCFGKMWSEHSHPTKGKISGLSWKRQRGSRPRMPLFLDLRVESGGQAGAFWETDGASLGAYSTHSFGECPSVAVESRLSQILEDTPHPKYYLSAKACAGILRRAEKRGKPLPPKLKEALERQSHCGCAKDVRGGGKGPLIQTDLSGTLGCRNDQTLIDFDYPSVARSLTARYDGSPCVDRGPNVVVAGFKPHAGAGAGSIGYSKELAPTIDTGKPMAVYDARGNGDGKIACTLTGDHQSRVTDYTAIAVVTGQARAEIMQDGCPTLNCHHEQPIIAHTLRAQGNDPHRADASTYPIANGIVRRLTPLECERLQGYPDGWTDIGPWTDSAGKLHKESSDAARYKALGNSIALPPWKWVLKRLCACYERDATMGSLFDGVGGFPLLWERLNGPGTCLWASEIEEFCIAVTKKRIGE